MDTNRLATATEHDDRVCLERLIRGLARGATDVDAPLADAVADAATSGTAIRAPTAWVRGVARKQRTRALRDAARRARRERAAARPEALPSAHDELERRELQRHLRDAVHELHEPYRTAIQLRFFEDCKPAAIAQRTGAPVETVRVRVRRGLALLRERLDAGYGGRAAWIALAARIEAREAASAATGAGLAPWVAGVAMIGAVAIAGVAGLRPTTAPPATAEAHPAAEPLAGAPAQRSSTPTVDARRAPVAATEQPTAGEPGRRSPAPTSAATRVMDDRRGAAVLDLLQRIAKVQQILAADSCLDADGDGIGEHGYLLEVLGHLERPGARPPSRSFARESAMLRAVLRVGHHRSPSPVNAGVVTSHGYAFQMFLPGVNGTPLPEATDGGPTPQLPDPDRAERSWCCYAWPLTSKDGPPQPVFFVDQTGVVLVADNLQNAYLGVGRGPSPAAALRADAPGAVGDPSAAISFSGRGQDGQIWRGATHPPTVTTTIEVVDDAGRPVSDARVAIVTADEVTADEDDLAVQRRALEGVTLAVGRSGSRTTADGQTTISGPALSDAVVIIAAGRSEIVPTRVSVVEDRVRVELPQIADLEAARFDANESAAIATLRNILSAQAQCQAAAVIDVNGNGAGEYGYFAELAGTTFVRGAHGPTTDKIAPPVLSAAFGAIRPATDALPVNVVVRSGYCFQIFLPDPDRRGVPEAPGGGAGAIAPDPALSEVIWCCYAWPMTYGASGRRAFFVNQGGDVLACANDGARYSGLYRRPAPDAIFPADGDGTLTQALEAKSTGTDGEEWSVVF